MAPPINPKSHLPAPESTLPESPPKPALQRLNKAAQLSRTTRSNPPGLSRARQAPACPNARNIRPKSRDPRRGQSSATARTFSRRVRARGSDRVGLVRMLARHAAGAERYELGGGAVGRQAARHLPQLLQVSGGGRELTGASTRELTDDVLLAGTLGNEAVDRCERHAMRRARTFLRTLDKLTALQAARRQPGTPAVRCPPWGFPTKRLVKPICTIDLNEGWSRARSAARPQDGCWANASAASAVSASTSSACAPARSWPVRLCPSGCGLMPFAGCSGSRHSASRNSAPNSAYHDGPRYARCRPRFAKRWRPSRRASSWRVWTGTLP